MNDQSPVHDPQPERIDRREARMQRQAGRLADPSRGGSWVTGLVLIVLGVAFLMQNMGSFSIPLKSWWALFILIPAFGALDTGIRTYRSASNQLTVPARGSLLVGLVLTFVAVSFLFDLSWSYFGPVLIILVGIGILFTYKSGNSE